MVAVSEIGFLEPFLSSSGEMTVPFLQMPSDEFAVLPGGHTAANNENSTTFGGIEEDEN